MGKEKKIGSEVERKEGFETDGGKFGKRENDEHDVNFIAVGENDLVIW